MFSFFSKTKSNDDPKSLQEAVLHIKRLEKKIQHMEEGLQACQLEVNRAISRVATVRYNPFREIGGNQSFSIALLNTQGEGVVLTSHYGRDMTRMYAKQIHEGSSSHSLSTEEQDAIDIALERKQEGPTKNNRRKHA
ncbi:MAG: DUF4446 family protein [bacterium]|nr:DUF4446 family protein [bacterium]